MRIGWRRKGSGRSRRSKREWEEIKEEERGRGKKEEGRSGRKRRER